MISRNWSNTSIPSMPCTSVESSERKEVCAFLFLYDLLSHAHKSTSTPLKVFYWCSVKLFPYQILIPPVGASSPEGYGIGCTIKVDEIIPTSRDNQGTRHGSSSAYPIAWHTRDGFPTSEWFAREIPVLKFMIGDFTDPEIHSSVSMFHHGVSLRSLETLWSRVSSI